MVQVEIMQFRVIQYSANLLVIRMEIKLGLLTCMLVLLVLEDSDVPGTGGPREVDGLPRPHVTLEVDGEARAAQRGLQLRRVELLAAALIEEHEAARRLAWTPREPKSVRRLRESGFREQKGP